MTEERRKRKMTFEEAIEDMRRKGIKVSVNDPAKRRGNAEIIVSPRKQFREWYEQRAREEQDDE